MSRVTPLSPIFQKKITYGTVEVGVAGGIAPTVPSSQRFEYTGGLQQFTVPDDVFSITVEVAGSGGGPGNPSNPSLGGGDGGLAAVVTADFVVTPGSVIDVYVGGRSLVYGGGQGGLVSGSNDDGGIGGDYSAIAPEGAAVATSAMLIAGGGGGGGGGNGGNGGDGGYPNGAAGAGGVGLRAGEGGTQTAGGAPGPSPNIGGGGGLLSGGDAAGGGLTTDGGGGGAGGYYGGGAGSSSGGASGAGGGGSCRIAPAATNVSVTAGILHAFGYIEFRWEIPRRP